MAMPHKVYPLTWGQREPSRRNSANQPPGGDPFPGVNNTGTPSWGGGPATSTTPLGPGQGLGLFPQGGGQCHMTTW